MTTSTITVPAPVAHRPRLVSRALACVLLAEFGALTSFYLLLSVLPRYVGGAGAGMTTAAMMVTTVVGEFLTPRLVARFGYRGVLAVGLLLLGVPALALPAAGLAGLVAISVLRGAGLAIIFVVAGALGAALIPAERRGEGLGVFGAVVSLPALVGTPLGVWLADRAGYEVVFVLGAVTALASLGAVRGLPNRLRVESDAPAELGVLTVMRRSVLVRVSLVFAATAVAAGVLLTFLPVALPSGTGDLAALALLLNAGTGAATRWWAGRFGDRHGAHRLLVPGVLLTAAGMVGLLALHNAAAVLVASVVVGAGFGIAQNASMAILLQRVPASGYTAVTALWSIAYDGGFGLGALAIGALAVQTGFPMAFAVTGLLAAASVAVLVRARIAPVSSTLSRVQ
jgi:MFS family permease